MMDNQQDGRCGSNEPPGQRAFGVEPASAVSSIAATPNAWRPHSHALTPKDRRILVLCDEDAPYPVMIAAWNPEKGHFVSSDTGLKRSWNILGWQPLPEPGPVPPVMLVCSFCGKETDKVAKLIAGPSAMICDECVRLCREIIEPGGEADAPNPPTPAPHNG